MKLSNKKKATFQPITSATDVKFNDYDFYRFKNAYMLGLGKLTDASLDELAAAIAYLVKERRSVRHDGTEIDEIDRMLTRIRDARDIKKDMVRGTYDLKKQITKDIWNCIQNQDVDFDALKLVRAKYRDHASIYKRIENRILNEEMWYD